MRKVWSHDRLVAGKYSAVPAGVGREVYFMGNRYKLVVDCTCNIFVSTYQLFPERYYYYRHEGDLCYLAYNIISQGIHPFFPNETQYYILFDFKDWFRVDEYLLKDEDEKEKRRISDRETNAVLEDLHRLCKQEIEKADREVSDALENMYRVTGNT